MPLKPKKASAFPRDPQALLCLEAPLLLYKRQNLEYHGCTNASLTLDWAQYLRSSQIQLQPTAACVTSGKPPPQTLSCDVLLSPSQMRCSSLLAALVTEDHSWGWYQCSYLTISRDGVDSGSLG